MRKRVYHHDHHGDAAPTNLSEAEKARILLAHMLDHNRHHEEEMASLAQRFGENGQTAAAKKVRIARARMVEANLALMEALELAKIAAPAEAR
ncbi:MAG: hypothetical protein IKI82_00975 [Lachnospiraceae bacterium]|nr:hypothetical protein [Lachnospiraceae bacterium]